MSEAREDLPTRADDPRLAGWYHTIELGNGLVSRGSNDHRTVVNRYGIPKSLAGMTALDVGTFDGFWAFELERRGADRVTALDVASIGDFDWLPNWKALLGPAASRTSNFQLAHAMRGSRVEYKICNVYDLSPETVGTFDIVFCGDLLLHLMNPLRALVNMRSVAKKMVIVESTIDPGLEAKAKGLPLVRFGQRYAEKILGETCTYWLLTTPALCEMLEYAGFQNPKPHGTFKIPGGPDSVSVTAHVG